MLHHNEETKADLAFSFFDSLLGTTPTRTNSIDLVRIAVPQVDLSGLDDRFTEAEIWGVIKALHPEKLSRPDGFTARFLQITWDIIRLDIMHAFDAF